jgi:biotin carboxyl carrier protein
MSGQLQKLNIGGTEYETLIPERRKRITRSEDPKMLRAFIPGVITEVLVSAGQSVKQGAPLLAIEAMKMETASRAAQTGVINHVHVKPGDVLPKDHLLVEIEP